VQLKTDPLRPSCKTGNIEGAIMDSELGDAADPSPYWKWDTSSSPHKICVLQLVLHDSQPNAD